MSILGNIFGKIFHRNQPQAQTTAQAGTAPAQGAQAQPAQRPATQPTAQQPAQQQPAATTAAQPAATAAMDRVDVEEVLDGMLARKGEKLNWRSSIVDLMKLLDLDSSLQARKELADELKYTGDKGDSAAMNIWLHKQVMKKLEENGGKVPADLKD